MTPRVELVMLDLSKPTSVVLEEAVKFGHTRYPVYEGNAEKVTGLVRRDELLPVAMNPDLPVHAVLREPLYVPESAWANDVLAQLHERKQYEALVVDEYGDIAGMVTANNLISELVGVFGDEEEEAEMLVRRADGMYLANGSIGMHDLRDVLDLPRVEDEEFSTLAGYVLAHTGSIPSVGERIEVDGWALEVMALDGRRVDRVLITPPRGYALENPRGGSVSAHATRSGEPETRE